MSDDMRNALNDLRAKLKLEELMRVSAKKPPEPPRETFAEEFARRNGRPRGGARRAKRFGRKP